MRRKLRLEPRCNFGLLFDNRKVWPDRARYVVFGRVRGGETDVICVFSGDEVLLESLFGQECLIFAVTSRKGSVD